MRHITEKICCRCGITFLGGPSATYCLDCRAEREKERQAEYRRRKRLGLSRQTGDPQTCIDCGKQYGYYTGASARCPECVKTHGKMVDLQKSKKWNMEHKKEYSQAKADYYQRRKEKMQKMSTQPTGEKYITQRKDNGKYRVQIYGQTVKRLGQYDNLSDAIKARDTFLMSQNPPE